MLLENRGLSSIYVALLYFISFVYLLIWLCRVLVVALKIFIVSRGFSSCVLSLDHVGSAVLAFGLFSGPLACGILVSRPEIEPVLEGGFLTTGPPGKSL